MLDLSAAGLSRGLKVGSSVFNCERHLSFPEECFQHRRQFFVSYIETLDTLHIKYREQQLFFEAYQIKLMLQPQFLPLFSFPIETTQSQLE